MINPDILKILCCPETHQPLQLANDSVVNRVNEQITRGAARNRGGKPVTTAIDQALIRQDGKFLYPVRNNIPVMLMDEAIPVP